MTISFSCYFIILVSSHYIASLFCFVCSLWRNGLQTSLICLPVSVPTLHSMDCMYLTTLVPPSLSDQSKDWMRSRDQSLANHIDANFLSTTAILWATYYYFLTRQTYYCKLILWTIPNRFRYINTADNCGSGWYFLLFSSEFGIESFNFSLSIRY